MLFAHTCEARLWGLSQDRTCIWLCFSKRLGFVNSGIALTHCMEFIVAIRLPFKFISGLTNVLLKSFIWKEVNIQSQ